MIRLLFARLAWRAGSGNRDFRQGVETAVLACWLNRADIWRSPSKLRVNSPAPLHGKAASVRLLWRRCIIPPVKSSHGANSSMGTAEPAGNRIRSIFTDVHFWVPAAVLLGGLLLLRFLH
jgi:hypothetical protein